MSPISSWPISACSGMPKICVTVRGDSTNRGTCGDMRRGAGVDPLRVVRRLLHQRTLARIERAEGLVRGNGRADLVVIPRVLRFRGLLHLDEIRRMDLA